MTPQERYPYATPAEVADAVPHYQQYNRSRRRAIASNYGRTIRKREPYGRVLKVGNIWQQIGPTTYILRELVKHATRAPRLRQASYAA